MINRLPWRKKLRNTAANNLDKINEVIDYINHSDISPVALSECGNGYDIVVGTASSVKALHMKGKAVQDGTPTPDNPVPIEVVRGRNLLEPTNVALYRGGNGLLVNDSSNIASYIARVHRNTDYVVSYNGGNRSNVIGTKSTVPAAGIAGDYIRNTQTRVSPFTFNSGENDYVLVQLGYNPDTPVSEQQLELGTTPTPYVPYGHVGLEVRDSSDELVSVTPIPLPSKGFAAALPDGTADTLAIDAAGRCEWKSVTTVRTLNGDSSEAWANYDEFHGFLALNFLPANMNRAYGFCSITPVVQAPLSADTLQCWLGVNTPILYLCGVQTALSITTVSDWRAWLAANPVTVIHPLATPTTEHAYINLPDIPDGATVKISASVQIAFNMEWWVYDDVTDIITALKDYTDWKVEV